MDLTTAEKFILLAQHPQKGRLVITGNEADYGVIGALLLEMTFDKRVIIEDNRVVLKNDREAGDFITNDITGFIRRSKKPRKLAYWINRLGSRTFTYRRMLMEGLANRGIIRIEYPRFLGLIPYRRYYLADSRQRDQLIRQLRDCIMHGRDADLAEITLLGMVEACTMHRVLAADRNELKQIRKELRAVLKKSPVAQAVDQTIRDAQDDLFATMASASAASAAANNV